MVPIAPYYYIADRSQAIKQLQGFLRQISFSYPSIPGVKMTGIYDVGTRAAVIAFQELFELPVTGTVPLQTWDAIYRAYGELIGGLGPIQPIALFSDSGATLGVGDLSEDVSAIKLMINYLSRFKADLMPEAPNPRFTQRTESNIAELQRQYDLGVTGMFDPPTRDALIADYNHYRTTPGLRE